MAKLVLLNFADPKPIVVDVTQAATTLVDRSALAIRRKKAYRPGRVKKFFQGTPNLEVVELYEALENYREGRTVDGTVIADAKARCGNAEKVMACIHGVYTDTEHGYATVTTEDDGYKIDRFVKYDVMANFVGTVLPQNSRCNLALIMCYGGRSGAAINHEAALSADVLKRSFAFKFFKILAADRPLRMTARTGFTGFNETTGHSEVSTEASIGAEEEWRAIQDAEETKALKSEAMKALGRLQQHYTARMKYSEGIDAAAKHVAALANNTRQPAGEDDVALKKYELLKARSTALGEQKNEVRTKYGKLLYRYEKDVLKIYRKYPDMDLLYSGPML